MEDFFYASDEIAPTLRPYCVCHSIDIQFQPIYNGNVKFCAWVSMHGEPQNLTENRQPVIGRLSFVCLTIKKGREPIDRKFKKREPEDPKTGESVYSADSPVCVYSVSYSHFTGSIRDARVCVNNL